MIKNSHKTKNVWPNVSIYTDRDCESPDLTTVVCAAHNYHYYINRSYFLHTTDNARLRWLLEQPGVIDWNTDEIMFETVPFKTLEVTREICREKGFHLHCEEKCLVITVQSQELVHTTVKQSLPNGFSVGRIKADTVSILDHSWWEVNDTPPPNFSKSLQYCYTSCVYETNGQPVSWAMFKEYGDIGNVHTVPQFRGRGFAKFTVANVAVEMLKQGHTPYAIVEVNNNASLRMFKKLGFQICKDYNSAWWVFKKKSE